MTSQFGGMRDHGQLRNIKDHGQLAGFRGKTAVESDALTVARWCWPGVPWTMSKLSGAPEVFFSNCEDILIERGHAEAYGRALHLKLGMIDPNDIDWRDVATIATAPLAARLSAMAEVIRNLDKKGVDGNAD